MMCMGVIMGPFNHYWYTFLDKVLPGATSSTVVKKILMDQIIASPYFAFSFFVGKCHSNLGLNSIQFCKYPVIIWVVL